ncbi:MAG: ABC transporter substrate-binding protein [Flavobacteriaceae bacterium]|nr:ABC transporter substrate-binding protein [Flavobacteriaceae bacterium]|tara:strand:- start:142555 stop:143409 length:855 start_codon:yes stop_codon:yes gene_type:complete
MLDLKIGGVPEHFNYPWYLAFKAKEFRKRNINLRWKDCYGGTGEMCAGLRSGDIDIAVVLTEGIIKDIINGNPSKIVQVFVESPLLWGIHVDHNSHFQTIKDLENKSVAISRYGSGSQLMAIVNAHNQGWNVDELDFKVVQNLSGGIEALTNGEADYFMWEQFTTKPLVDNQTFRRIDSCPTPWPCFVIAVRDEVLESHEGEIKVILDIINDYTRHFKSTPKLSHLLAKRYGQKIEDIRAWLNITNWNSDRYITKNLIARIQNKMVKYNVIKKKENSARFIKKL